jgi:hypothetical protein
METEFLLKVAGLLVVAIVPFMVLALLWLLVTERTPGEVFESWASNISNLLLRGLLIIRNLIKFFMSSAKPKGRNGENTIPRLAKFLIEIILEKVDRENILGDLEEEYSERIALRGTLKTKLWFYKQVLFSVWPLFHKEIRRRFSSEHVK